MTDNGAKVILVDKNDNVIGHKDKLEAHKHPVPLHRAVSVVIFDPAKDKILIQKRSVYKPTWPLYWSNTVCTHPKKGESYVACAKRRLKQELGITVDVKEEFNFIYKSKFNDVYGENELDHVFVGEYSGEVKPDLKEVDDYKWMGIDELKREIKKNPKNYTPWFKIILKKMKV